MSVQILDSKTLVRLDDVSHLFVNGIEPEDDRVYVVFVALFSSTGFPLLCFCPEEIFLQTINANYVDPDTLGLLSGTIIQFDTQKERDELIEHCIKFKFDEFSPSTYMEWMQLAMGELLFDAYVLQSQTPQQFWNSAATQALVEYGRILDGDNDNVDGMMGSLALLATHYPSITICMKSRTLNVDCDTDFTVDVDYRLNLQQWVNGGKNNVDVTVTLTDDYGVIKYLNGTLQDNNSEVDFVSLAQMYFDDMKDAANFEGLSAWMKFVFAKLDELVILEPEELYADWKESRNA